MRLIPYLRLAAALVLLLQLGTAAVLDRVALVIDKKVITESEVIDELRLTEFLNSQPLDLGPAARRAAAEHLVDQELLRREIEISNFSLPAAGEADMLLWKFRQDRFPTPAAYRAALQKYEISEDQLREHLLWQLTAIRYTDFRFRSLQTETSGQSADRAADDTADSTVDHQMDAWLKQARANAKIAFKLEAFQ